MPLRRSKLMERAFSMTQEDHKFLLIFVTTTVIAQLSSVCAIVRYVNSCKDAEIATDLPQAFPGMTFDVMLTEKSWPHL